MNPRWLAAVSLLASTACLDKGAGGDVGDGPGGMDPDPCLDDDAGNDPGTGCEPDPVDDTCPAMYGQQLFPLYEVEIADAEWDAINDEFINRQMRIDEDLDPTPYHPIQFTYDGETVDAMIRLKGNTSWVQAIEFDPDPKMQFVISFNETDPMGRFRGVRKIELDMPRSDPSYLRQRLGLYYLRSIGQPAQCANSARLAINGEYYGAYTNLERLDKEFLQRIFGSGPAADGDLWKGGRIIKTNEETFTYDRLEPLWDDENPLDIAGLDALVDLEASVKAWTAEAMMPHSDGYYMARPNYYLYDHPTHGFQWISHDLDSAYDYLVPTTDPMYGNCDPIEAYKCEGRGGNERQHWAIVLNDPTWNQNYVEDLRTARAGFDADKLSGLVPAWEEQIGAAVAADPLRPTVDVDHATAIASLTAYPAKRAAAVDAWLDCRDNGGEDGDGDGFDSCAECDDTNPDAFPGNPAGEICGDAVDNNCDFLVDDADEISCPPPTP